MTPELTFDQVIEELRPIFETLQDPNVKRFISFVDQGDLNACWPWNGGRDRQGYGHFWCDGKTHRAIRWAFERLVRPLEPGEIMRHTCDNPPCCNPVHLITGDAKANTGDMLTRGRRPLTLVPPRKPGTTNHKAKLSDDQVRAIRDAYRAGARQVDIAADYGIHQTNVSRIVRGEGWTHLT